MNKALFCVGGIGLMSIAVNAYGQAVSVSIPNASSTGTTIGQLAKLTAAPSTAVVTATSDVSGIVGVVVGWTGTQAVCGNAIIAVAGLANCTFDGATTANDYVTNSPTTSGNCHDAGVTPGSGQVVGRVLSTNAGSGLYQMSVFGQAIYGIGVDAYLNVNQAWTAGQAVTPDTSASCGTITNAGSATPNFANSNSCQLTFTAAASATINILNPTNQKIGQDYLFTIAQSSSGNGTIASYGNVFDFGAAGTPTLTTASGKIDQISCYAFASGGANSLQCSLVAKGF